MKNYIPLFLFIAVLFTSCSTPVHVEKSPSINIANYHTYTWVDLKRDQNDNRNVTGLAKETVRSAADQALRKLGWTQTMSNPDVLLSYDVLVERSRQQQSEPVYTQPFSRVYFNPFFGRWGTVYYPSRFIGYDNYTIPVKEGTLTLTMTDAHSDKTLWQGWTTETLTNNKFSGTEAQRAVKRILKKLQKG
jgi:hypothetical protein